MYSPDGKILVSLDEADEEDEGVDEGVVDVLSPDVLVVLVIEASL